jgi:hypothetical protein
MASSGSGMLYTSGVLWKTTNWSTSSPTAGVFTVPHGQVFVGQIGFSGSFSIDVPVYIEVGSNPFLTPPSFTMWRYGNNTGIDLPPRSVPLILGGDMSIGIDSSAWASVVLTGVLYINP